MSDAQVRLVLAETELQQAEAALRVEERAAWKTKAKEFARQAREAFDNFRAAKLELAEAVSAQQQRGRQSMQIEADLAALEQEYRAIEFPNDSETAAYEHGREKLLEKLDACRPDPNLAAQQAHAREKQVRFAAEYEAAKRAYQNAMALARGSRPGAIEGGLAEVR